jgi:preprotein translocase subunit SecF
MKFGLGNVQFFDHDFYFDFMKYRKLFVGVSALLTLVALGIIAIKGVNYSIDFLGGAEIQVEATDATITRDVLEEEAQRAGIGAVEITSISDFGSGSKNQFVLRLQHEKGKAETEVTGRVDKLVGEMKKAHGDKIAVVSTTNISGKIGKEEEVRGYIALLLACVGILIYIAIRFDRRFAPGGVICLVHDVLIALGFMTLIDRPFSVSSIAAFLTIVGYSINDTVIIYDRIRESQALFPKMPIVEVINRSISQTMNRTVLTASTGLAALLVLTVFAGGVVEDFALTMFVGILVGTYSSIYVAAPLTIMMSDLMEKFGWNLEKADSKAVVVKDPNYIPPVMLKKRTDK